MAVAAELTSTPAAPIILDVGTDTRYGHSIEAEVRHLVSIVPQQDGSIRAAEQFFVHALAEHLDPGGEYHYRFRLPGGRATPDAVFTTAPAAGTRVPFTFTAFADHGVNAHLSDATRGYTDDYYRPDDTRRSTAPATTMAESIAARQPTFHLLAGDICYADPTGFGRPIKNNTLATPATGFDNFDPITWTAYFASIESSASITPWMFATGHADMEALYDDNTSPGGAQHGYGGHLARLDLPKTGPTPCPSVYTFNYGNVGVISLDTNDLSTEITTNIGYSGGAQTTWLRRTLTALRADPTLDFIVVFFHHCAFATGAAHGSDGGARTVLAPLFDEFAVDLVLQGHNHQYERTNPIRGGHAPTQAPDRATVHPHTDGTTYICVGSGGRPHDSWQPTVTDRFRGFTSPNHATVASFVTTAGGDRTAENVEWSQSRYQGYAYLKVDVVPLTPAGESKMIITAISDTSDVLDEITLVRKPGGGKHPRPLPPGA